MTAVPALPFEPEIPASRTSHHILGVIRRDSLALTSSIFILLFILIALFAYQKLCIEWRQKKGLPDEAIARNSL